MSRHLVFCQANGWWGRPFYNLKFWAKLTHSLQKRRFSIYAYIRS